MHCAERDSAKGDREKDRRFGADGLQIHAPRHFSRARHVCKAVRGARRPLRLHSRRVGILKIARFFAAHGKVLREWLFCGLPPRRTAARRQILVKFERKDEKIFLFCERK